MVYSVETVTETFWARLFFIIIFFLFRSPPLRCFVENCDVDFFVK